MLTEQQEMDFAHKREVFERIDRLRQLVPECPQKHAMWDELRYLEADLAALLYPMPSFAA